MNRKQKANLLRGLVFGFCNYELFARFTNDPTLPGDGGGDTLPANGGGGNPNPAPKTYSQREFTGITRDRDRLKKQFKAIARSLGLDPEELEFVESDDPENPLEVTGEGWDEIVSAIEKAKGEPKDGPAKKAAEEQKKKRLTRPLEQKIARLEAERKALQTWIERNSVVASIRLAAANEHAVDDDGGMFSDIVGLIRPRMPVSVQYDADTNEAEVFFSARNEDGTDVEGATGDPQKDAQKLVADLLAKKPKFKNANFRPGPGAGGAGGRPAASASRPNKIAAAVKAFTGIEPPSSKQ